MKLRKLSVLPLMLLMLAAYCTKHPEKVAYKPVTIDNPVDQFVSKEILSLQFALKSDIKIYLVSFPNVWVVDLEKREEKVLFKKGIGPNEVYWPCRIVEYNGEIYINSFWPLKHIYHFKPGLNEIKMQNMDIPTPTTFTDFSFLSSEKLAMVSVNWEEGDLLRIYDLKTGQHQSMGERKFVPLMKKFNVNEALMCVLEDRIYIVQTIVPEIQVVSTPEQKVIDKIKLSPPFYKPMPAEYKVNPQNRKQQLGWQGLWTALYDIAGKDNWLLVTYQTWVDEEKRYFYELINIKDSSNRFFIDATPYMVYDFEISGGKVSLDMCQEKEDGVRWLKADVRLP